MVRLAAALCLLPIICSAHAMAGQASARFNVGITIGGPSKPKPPKHYTWNAAAISVIEAGFDNPERDVKSDDLYWFRAERDGNMFRIAVSVSSGSIVSVIPV